MDGKGGANVLPPSRPIQLDTSALPDTASSSLWDRITSWASDNKALVYTIAGVTVLVTAAGVVYYTSESKSSSGSNLASKKSSKKSKRKAKKADDEKATSADDIKEKSGMSNQDWMNMRIY
jgi:import receptor subunit TOM70